MTITGTDSSTDVGTVIVLTAHDRCDRCMAQAYVVTEHGPSRLKWCQHHFNENKAKLQPAVIFPVPKFEDLVLPR